SSSSGISPAIPSSRDARSGWCTSPRPAAWNGSIFAPLIGFGLPPPRSFLHRPSVLRELAWRSSIRRYARADGHRSVAPEPPVRGAGRAGGRDDARARSLGDRGSAPGHDDPPRVAPHRLPREPIPVPAVAGPAGGDRA